MANDRENERESRRDDVQHGASDGANLGDKSEWMERNSPSASDPVDEGEKKAHRMIGGSGLRDGAISGASGLNGLDERDQNRDRSAEHRNNEPGDVGGRGADGR